MERSLVSFQKLTLRVSPNHITVLLVEVFSIGFFVTLTPTLVDQQKVALLLIEGGPTLYWFTTRKNSSESSEEIY